MSGVGNLIGVFPSSYNIDRGIETRSLNNENINHNQSVDEGDQSSVY